MTDLTRYNYHMIMEGDQPHWYNIDQSRMTPDQRERFKRLERERRAREFMQYYRQTIISNLKPLAQTFYESQYYPKKRRTFELAGVNTYLHSRFCSVVSNRSLDNAFDNCRHRRFFHFNPKSTDSGPKNSQLVAVYNNQNLIHIKPQMNITIPYDDDDEYFSYLLKPYYDPVTQFNTINLIETYKDVSSFSRHDLYEIIDDRLVSKSSNRIRLGTNPYTCCHCTIGHLVLQAAHPKNACCIDFESDPNSNDDCAVIGYPGGIIEFVSLNWARNGRPKWRNSHQPRKNSRILDICKLDENRMIISATNHYLAQYDKRMFGRKAKPVVEYGKHYNTSHFHQINIDRKRNLIISSGSDDIVRFWNIDNGQLCYCLNLNEADYFGTNNDYRLRQAYFAKDFSLYDASIPDRQSQPKIKGDTLIIADGDQIKFLANDMLEF
ncbi:uncharacterized protein LOC124494505 [Dermatophagoides farinae]|uniref:uncharacterized protein LOC124494505 n=1 Tax=Dermatophagoides farinae TaxID=6954 RepID=UPI003F5DF4FA